MEGGRKGGLVLSCRKVARPSQPLSLTMPSVEEFPSATAVSLPRMSLLPSVNGDTGDFFYFIIRTTPNVCCVPTGVPRTDTSVCCLCNAPSCVLDRSTGVEHVLTDESLSRALLLPVVCGNGTHWTLMLFSIRS